MKNQAWILAVALILCSACQKKPEYLLLGGSGWDKIAIVNKDTKKTIWEHPLEKGWECNSVAVTPEGNILFSYSKGAKLIDREHRELWDIPAPEGCEMQTARVLPDGNCLLAWCGSPARIMEVSPEGKILSETGLDTGIEQPHAQFRQVNKNERGNYLVPLFATSEVREIAPTGQLVKSVKVEGTPFCAVPAGNGNYWVACGDAHAFQEVNLDSGEVVRTIGREDIAGAPLFFVAQLLPKADGGLYICNWQGHDPAAASGGYPQLVEIDKAGEVVWSLNDNAAFGMISSVCPVD